MMLSGQVHLCHLLAPNQVYAFNQTNDDLSGDKTVGQRDCKVSRMLGRASGWHCVNFPQETPSRTTWQVVVP
jgi:hypothetical protein